MPDGLVFDIPGQDAGAGGASTCRPTRATNWSCSPSLLQRPGVAETDAESDDRFDAAALPAPTRSTSATRNVTGERAAPVQIGRLNLRLMLARDAVEGYATIGLCRVVERRADNKLVLDTQYMPPTLHVGGNDILSSYLRELHGLLHQRGEALAARLAQPGRAGVGEIADFLLLEPVNRNEPLFAQLRQTSVLHPKDFYHVGVGAGRRSRRPSASGAARPTCRPTCTTTRHGCFRPLMDDLRQSLSMVMEQTAIPIELQDRKHGVRVAMIPDIELQRNAQFVLAVNAQMPGDALRVRFPTQVKIGTVERIRDLVNLQLPGVTVRPLPVAPRQIPYHAGFTYFELETRGNDMWKQLETSGGLAMHVAGDFPGPRARVLGGAVMNASGPCLRDRLDERPF